MEANMETKLDSKMIEEMNTNLTILNRQMCSLAYRLAIQVRELAKGKKEQPSRQLVSDIKNDDIQECESVTFSLEDELSSPTLGENKDIMECDKLSLILERKFQVLSLVEKNDLAIAEEPSLKEMQVEKKHPELIIENVLVEVEDFNFPINSLTFGMEKNRQVSNVERPSIATSQVWIDAKTWENDTSCRRGESEL